MKEEEIDLSKLTQLGLLDLRKRVNDELNSFDNRSKTACYSIFKHFEGTTYFIHKENALAHLKKMIEWDDIFEDEESKIELSVKYLNEAEIEQYCRDYKENNSDKPKS